MEAENLTFIRTLKSTKKPTWVNQEQSMINIEAEFEELGVGFISVTVIDGAGEAHIQDLWDNAVAGAYGEIAPYVVPKPLSEPIPQEVSRFQARAALYNAGLLPVVETAIANADELVKMAWTDAQEFQRNSPTILAMAAMLDLTPAQVDDLFIAAAQIVA